ncbi:hypothetical protein [Acinetobacter nosocomialis]|uniref:hypothetical protein n=1 Tax=Acinetobacter nosocomialis TaxID=106654 RepID=UPI000DE5E966|nr:hypothetical protein [Acinetobacter nosocomialis]SSV77565.1 Uncharacterised protein [Acinetobacter nosocomialis]
MTAAHTTSLNYLGKYVSFNTDSSFEISGVISNIIFNMDGSIEFSLGWNDFFSFDEVSNLKVLGEVNLYP